MALLTDSDAEQVRTIFGALSRDVMVRLYTRRLECPSCAQTESILTELEGLSDRLTVRKLNQLTDQAESARELISEVPAVLVSDGSHDRVRFYGTPSGYEFTSLLTAIVDAGSESVPLEESTVEFLAGLDRDIHFRVFVTPTCPHCPRAVVLAHRLAMGSGRVRSEAVAANEFPELSRRFRVQGVPRTVVNDEFYVEGAIPEGMMVRALGAALADTGQAGPKNLLDYLTDR